MSLSADELWIIAIATLVGISCALVGVFLVLRRMSMLADAISHSVLLGIVLGFLIFGSRAPLIMLVGAAVIGWFTAYLTSVLTKHGKLQQDASIGVTFTWMFALGVILISVFAHQVDLDQDCVLYGEIAFAPFDRVLLGGTDLGPRAFWVLLFVTFADAVFVILGFRRLKIVSFDPLLGAAQGVAVSLWHYALMTFVAITTVAAFESVGAILVVALLVVPANTAYLFASSVQMMLIWALVFASLSAWGGYFLAARFDSSISASVALVSGLFFVLVILGIGPHSVVARFRRKFTIAPQET